MSCICKVLIEQFLYIVSAMYMLLLLLFIIITATNIRICTLPFLLENMKQGTVTVPLNYIMLVKIVLIRKEIGACNRKQ